MSHAQNAEQSRCSKCKRKAELFLCWECAKDLRDNLDQIPWLAEQVGISATGGDQLQGPGELTSSSDIEIPLPFSVKASLELDQMEATLSLWVKDLCDSRAIEFMPLRSVKPGTMGPLLEGQWRLPTNYRPTIRQLARWLSHHFAAIMHSEDAGQCYFEIYSLVRSAQQVINRPIPPIYCGPCPSDVGKDHRDRVITCDQPLYAPRDEAFVWCWKCGKSYDVNALKRQIFAKADNFLMTATEVFRVLDELGEHLPRNRFYRWKDEHKIEPRGWKSIDGRITEVHSDQARPVFALSDVRALMANHRATA